MSDLGPWFSPCGIANVIVQKWIWWNCWGKGTTPMSIW